MPAPEDASPFAGTAPYYDRFRAPYAPAALDCVIEAYGLGAGSRVLDLGCGPGTIAIPLSRRIAEVVAVDPDAGMIAEGRRLAAESGRTNIQWLNASAEEVSPEAGPFQAVTIGQAFHWLDRDAVLAKLGVLIADGGGLALINPGKRRPQESWEPAAEAVIARFLGHRTRHPKSNPREPTNEPALLRSEHLLSAQLSRVPEHDHPRRGLDHRLRLFDLKLGKAAVPARPPRRSRRRCRRRCSTSTRPASSRNASRPRVTLAPRRAR